MTTHSFYTMIIDIVLKAFMVLISTNQITEISQVIYKNTILITK